MANMISRPRRRATIASVRVLAGLFLLISTAVAPRLVAAQPSMQEYAVPPGSHPHDVAPAVDGGVWFTAQAAGYLGWLDPSTGEVRQIPLGPSSAPHGVITGPDGAAWVTDGGQNAILRVDPLTSEVRVFPLPGRNANLNTATFDRGGILWFTGQTGVYGRLDPATGDLQVFEAPRGQGPYGITATADGSRVFYASLAGSHVAEINRDTAQATPIDPPTPDQGARRVWTDSHGVIWVSEWNAGQLGRFDPESGQWSEWKLPGSAPHAYAVYVDEQDAVWLSDWGTNALVRFDPASQNFEPFVIPQSGAAIRQINGRPGEVWAAESGQDRLVVVRH
jgi:virginiamycin B lyase